MADGTKVSALDAATNTIGAELLGIQGGGNKRFPASLFSRDYVSPLDYVAVADGITPDDTALASARNAAISSGRWLDLEGKTYALSSTFTCSDPALKIRNGTLKAVSAMNRVAYITGDGPILDGVTFDANGNSPYGLQCDVASVDMTACAATDCVSTGSTGCFGFYINGATGRVTIDRAVVTNVTAANNSVLGDSFGSARAILVVVTTQSEKIDISNCYVDEVRGEDGDGIAITGGGIANATIRNNFINNCDRRHIKTQVSNVDIVGNRLRQDGADPASPSSCISMQVGSNCRAINNDIDGQKFVFGVDAGIGGTNVTGIVIRGNSTRGGTAIVAGAATYGIALYNTVDAEIISNFVTDYTRFVFLSLNSGFRLESNVWSIVNGAARGNGVNTSGANTGGKIRFNVARGIGTFSFIAWGGSTTEIEHNVNETTGGDYTVVSLLASLGVGNTIRANISNGTGNPITGTTFTDTGTLIPPAMNLIEGNHNKATGAIDGVASTFSTSRRGTATLNIPAGAGVFEYTETVALSGVTASNIIFVSLAPSLDTDENDPEMTSVSSISGAAGSGQFDVEMTFPEPHSGPIKIQYQVM